MNNFAKSAQALYFQTGKERSVDFALSFSERSARPYVVRLTGGCANMTAADGIGMRNLTDALTGKLNRKFVLPRFAGFATFGGTRMLSIHDPKIVVPGITEIFPTVAKHCPDIVMLGLVANFHSMLKSKDRRLRDKLILSIDEGKGVVTVVHPELQSALLLQPTPDREEPWDDEYKETYRLIKALHLRNWQSLLIVYNGGTVTKREMMLWAEAGRMEPGRWPVLIIKGSGRIADEYAQRLESDPDFAAAHKDFHIAENSVVSINTELNRLGALVARTVPADDSGKVIPFRRAG